MKCSLTSLIDALKLEFPLETCGDMALQISDLQGLTPDNPPTRPDPAAQSSVLPGADSGALHIVRYLRCFGENA